MTTTTAIFRMTAADPAGELFRQALGLDPMTSLVVIASAPTAAQALLVEVWDATKPARPAKRYLYTTDGRGDRRPVCAFMPHKAEQLAALLSHPEIKITIVDAETAIDIYNDLEAQFPSRETLRNGQPRQYLPPVLD